MPSKTRKKAAAALPSIPKEIIGKFVCGPMTAEAVNAASMAELGHHLGYPPRANKPTDAGNYRNGVSGKTVLTEDGPLRIEVARPDRQFRALAHPQARMALYRFRRQDRRHVRARDDGP